MTDQPRVKAGQAYRRHGKVDGRFYVANERPSDLPLQDANGHSWFWCATKYAPFLEDVVLVRPYNDSSLLGCYTVDGDESFWPDELAAARVEQRLGVAVARHRWSAEWADRRLSQDETDALIYVEVWNRCDPSEQPELERLFGKPRCDVTRKITHQFPNGKSYEVESSLKAQRGGIHSEPLMRILAYRTWGDRDRLFNFEAHKMQVELAIAQIELATRSPAKPRRLRFDPPIHNIPRDSRETGARYHMLDGTDRSPAERRAAVRGGLAHALQEATSNSPHVNPIIGGRKR